jgi:hypothetical protein
MNITPTPSPEEAVAIAAAVQALLEATRHGGADPLPAAYRSEWRRSAIREGVGQPIDDRRTR